MRASRGGFVLTLIWAAFLLAAGSSSLSASAASLPGALWRSPEDGAAGTSAGRLGSPQAIAADPVTGSVFVVEQANARISEFDVWGQFVRAWGWGVRDGAAEFQICTSLTGCQAGASGSGPGQIDRTTGGGGLAVAPDGSVYVADLDNFRIEKFDSSGNFLLEFGEAGTGPGQFELGPFGQFNTNLSVGPDGTVYVAEKKRIQAFEPDGTFKDEIAFDGELEPLKGRVSQDLAVDASGNLYVTALHVNQIFKLDATGNLVSPGTFPLLEAADIAIDADGNVYTTKGYQEVVEFSPDGDLIIEPGSGFADVDLSLTGLATSNACGIDGTHLYVSATNGTTQGSVTAYGPPPDPNQCPPPARAPTISAQLPTDITAESAQVRAKINPHFWLDTTFYVEYGLGKCSEGGCPQRQPLADQPLTDQVVDRALPTSTVFLPGLQPATTYHFRFVAESSGGGPVFGVDPDGPGPEAATEAAGLERTFTTFPGGSPPSDPCPNAAFRSEFAPFLPDCRAYEMVSPVDKDGGEIFALFNSRNDPAALNQVSPEGDAATYSSFRSFGGAQGAPATSQYRATRTGGGWTSVNITPPRGTPHFGASATIESPYQLFSSDLCTAWLIHDTDPPLASEAVEGFPNLYKVDLCGLGLVYQALTTVEPVGQIPEKYNLDVQGASADGAHTVFRAAAKLTATAAETLKNQCYEWFEGTLRLVSVLPSGQANSTNCSIGTATSGHSNIGGVGFRDGEVHNAISADGSRIFWTATADFFGLGKLYVRIAGKNPTILVSQKGEQLSELFGSSQFLTASEDGSKVIFSVGALISGSADMYEYRLGDNSTHLIAPEARGMLGASEDASLVYFASEAVLSGPNGEGRSPVAGKPNLYLYDAGDESKRFIGVLSDKDAKSESFTGLSPLASEANQHTARVSEDGRIAAFMSTAPLTGFDNTDAVSGEPDAEVFRYDAAANGGEGGLACVSCNPTGAAPVGRELFGGSAGLQPFEIWAAAKITPWQTQLQAPRVLPEEGERVLFESYEPLVARDTNGKQDVYQWAAVGVGNCEEDSPDYSAFNDGCVSLISSGKSTRDSEFVDASESGRDIFFTTASSLVSQDPGLIDLYDAREGGGFPPPEEKAIPCQDEGCQSPGPAPGEQSPASQQPGSGNPTFKPPKTHNCPKGKTYSKKKKRCVKKQRRHKHHHKAKAGH